ncbi:MAG: cytochrome c peroxidase [Bacteroidota bacterium]
MRQDFNLFLGTLKKYTFILAVLILVSCADEPINEPSVPICGSSLPIGDDYVLDPLSYFNEAYIPIDNPMKQASVTLGRFLFWDKRLSGDNSMSCGTCHAPENAFGTNNEVEFGIDGIPGNRNAMPLVNLAFQGTFNWDGRSASLEEQALEPVVNPIEMHEDWGRAVDKIAADPIYEDLFVSAYGTACVDSVRITKSIAQFVRSMVSMNSKYDKWERDEIPFLSALEFEGLNLFVINGPPDGDGADCFHCHEPENFQFRIEGFSNNGLDSIFTDLGREEVTGFAFDRGKFKIPTLRNIEYTAPYMHDGRFQTLDQVIDHYNTGGINSPTIDPLMKAQGIGLTLTTAEKSALKAFLLTLSDPDFINNPDFKDPH